jgi:hypothetical protein
MITIKNKLTGQQYSINIPRLMEKGFDEEDISAMIQHFNKDPSVLGDAKAGERGLLIVKKNGKKKVLQWGAGGVGTETKTSRKTKVKKTIEDMK